MSLNIITLRDNFIFLSSDRRACMINHENINGAEVELVFCFDGDRKSYFFDPPHNFVGFSINGWEIIGINELIQEFKDSLPDTRITIKQYADRLSEFFSKKYSAKSVGLSNETLKFNVAGFDESGSKYYRFELPDKIIPEEIFNDVIDGKAEYLTPKIEFLNTLKTKLENKKYRNLIPTEKRLLNKLREGKDPFDASMKNHFIENSKYLIEFVSKEQARRDEMESVGGGSDILIITPEDGVSTVSYGEKDQVISDLAQHYVLIKCCGESSKIQIDFNKPTKKGYISFPTNNIFRCKNCSKEIDLTDVKKRFLSRV